MLTHRPRAMLAASRLRSSDGHRLSMRPASRRPSRSPFVDEITAAEPRSPRELASETRRFTPRRSRSGSRGNLELSEEERDLLLRRLGRIGAVHGVSLDVRSHRLTDRALD